MQLQSHNIKLIPEVTHYDINGNKVKTITYPPKQEIGDESNIELTLYEADGEVKDVFILPFRSFTKQFAQVLANRLSTFTGTVNIFDTGGTARSQRADYNTFGYSSGGPGAGVYTAGIQIGASGSATATASVFATASCALIANGTGLGSMSYAAQTYDANLTAVSSSYKFSIGRVFTNNSAGNVNVKEVCFVGNSYAAAYKYLIARDLIDSNGNAINVTVAPAQVLTVRYNFYCPAASGISKSALAALLSEMNAGGVVTNALSQLNMDDFYESVDLVDNSAIYNWYMLGPVNNVWNGIALGTGTATESMNIYGEIPRYIASGSNAGQLLYSAGQVDIPISGSSTTGSFVEWNVKRQFTNGHTDPITVREAFIIVGWDSSYNNNSKYTIGNQKSIFARRLIGDNVITSGSTLEVNFKFMIEA